MKIFGKILQIFRLGKQFTDYLLSLLLTICTILVLPKIDFKYPKLRTQFNPQNVTQPIWPRKGGDPAMVNTAMKAYLNA